jgi:GH15 family glucan-1,4-alpha-glucosidase
MAYQPIENYGVIGDLHTAALVGRNGSIDWLCLPRFDSPSIFAAILDDKLGGRFQITAVDATGNRQLYVPDTNVLITRFYTPTGVGEVYDCMPIESDEAGEAAPIHDLVRVVHAVRGPVRFELTCRPAFDYARSDHEVQAVDDGCLFTSRGADGMRVSLVGTVPLEIRDGGATTSFVLHPDEWVAFVLQHVDDANHDAHQVDRRDPPVVQRRSTTGSAGSAARPTGGAGARVGHRSALTLSCSPTPRPCAGRRRRRRACRRRSAASANWDYRFTWIRDTSFMVFALMAESGSSRRPRASSSG